MLLGAGGGATRQLLLGRRGVGRPFPGRSVKAKANLWDRLGSHACSRHVDLGVREPARSERRGLYQRPLSWKLLAVSIS